MTNVPSTTNSAQGGVANRQGRVLENAVIGVFEQHGFEVVSFKDWLKSPESFGGELLLTNVPYRSIYGHDAKTEFRVQSVRLNFEARIECKWQQSSGSVDEKFPYLYLNCISAMPEDNIFIVLDGGGAKPTAVKWLKDAAKSRQFIPVDSQKQVDVFSLTEFIAWANKKLR
jgi:hypothetical protein